MELRKNSISLILLVCFLGALTGTVLGALIGKLVPALHPYLNEVGTGQRLIIDLHVLVFGIRINVAGVLGVLGALLIYRKL